MAWPVKVTVMRVDWGQAEVLLAKATAKYMAAILEAVRRRDTLKGVFGPRACLLLIREIPMLQFFGSSASTYSANPWPCV
jgi:hypothetical protein